MSLEHSPARGGVRVLRRKQILEQFGISNSTMELGQDRPLSGAVFLGPNTKAWLEADVDRHLD